MVTFDGGDPTVIPVASQQQVIRQFAANMLVTKMIIQYFRGIVNVGTAIPVTEERTSEVCISDLLVGLLATGGFDACLQIIIVFARGGSWGNVQTLILWLWELITGLLGVILA